MENSRSAAARKFLARLSPSRFAGPGADVPTDKICRVVVSLRPFTLNAFLIQFWRVISFRGRAQSILAGHAP